MRNGPQDAIEKTAFLLGGHRIGPWLPWYRGRSGVLEQETQFLFKYVQQSFNSSRIIALDVHSGFGLKDRLWFPYSKTSREFGHIREVCLLKALLDQSFPNHFYKVEPQSSGYKLAGDLWDHLYDKYCEQNKSGIFMPFTLEMGSWLWVKKNPWQMFSSLGPFNPVLPHRKQRILRRHWTLFDFLLRLLSSESIWEQSGDNAVTSKVTQIEREQKIQEIYQSWYS